MIRFWDSWRKRRTTTWRQPLSSSPLISNEVTDKDSDEEDEGHVVKNPNHLGKGILSKQVVLVIL